MLFILGVMTLVQAVHDGDPFPHATGAVGASGGPSLAFCGLRDVTGDTQLLVSVSGFIVPSVEVNSGRHLGDSNWALSRDHQP